MLGERIRVELRNDRSAGGRIIVKKVFHTLAIPFHQSSMEVNEERARGIRINLALLVGDFERRHIDLGGRGQVAQLLLVPFAGPREGGHLEIHLAGGQVVPFGPHDRYTFQKLFLALGQLIGQDLDEGRLDAEIHDPLILDGKLVGLRNLGQHAHHDIFVPEPMTAIGDLLGEFDVEVDGEGEDLEAARIEDLDRHDVEFRPRCQLQDGIVMDLAPVIFRDAILLIPRHHVG